jgi:pyruvate dehydrogenase E1 component alpha subunit
MWKKSSRRFSVIQITLPSFDTFMLDTESVPVKTETTAEELMTYFRQMTYIRRMELTCDSLYKNREIRGFCHL